MYGSKLESHEIILFGFGKVGHRIYEMLISSFSKITVADNREDIINEAKEYGLDSAFYIDLVDDSKLEELGLDNKILFCAMDEMSLNIFLVLSFKTISTNSTIISVSTSSESARKLKFIGADKVIDLYESSANRIVDIITRPAVTKVLDEIIYIDNEIRIEEIEIPPNTFLEGKYVNDIDFREFGLILIGITDKELGDDFIFVSRGINHKFDTGDILVLLGESQELENFYTLLMGQKDE